MANEAPEQLLDVFRAAALSVTKLYKSSISAQAKARADGYQDCLDDLLQFLDKENLGLDDGEGWKIRAWANDRLEARDGSPQSIESDDDADKPEPISSSEVHRSASTPAVPQASQHNPPQPSALRNESQTQTAPSTPILEEADIIVPTQETFDFRSSHPYPQDAQTQLNIANLRLSDNSMAHQSSATISTPRSSRSTRHYNGVRNNWVANHLGRGAGSKRKVNLSEFFDISNVGQIKDGLGGGAAKRGRHS